MLSNSINSIHTSKLDTSFLLPLSLSPSDDPESPSSVQIPQYPKKTGKWTFEEDDLLRKYVEIYGEKQWQKICPHIPGRTSIQCLHRWSKILKPGLVKGPWTQEEDEILTNWVKLEGPNKWAQAANLIAGRSGKQCRERWFNNLDPEIKKTEWTKEEDELVFELYKKHGSSWSKIAKFVHGRTENSIKNRFYSTLRKLTSDKKRIVLKSSFSGCSGSGQTAAADDDTEEETSSKTTTCEASSAEQTPHTLYKLLKDSAIVEEKEDQVDQDQESTKSEKEKKFMAKRGVSNTSGNSGNTEYSLGGELDQMNLGKPNDRDQRSSAQKTPLSKKENIFLGRQNQMLMSPLEEFNYFEARSQQRNLLSSSRQNNLVDSIPQLNNQMGCYSSLHNKTPQHNKYQTPPQNRFIISPSSAKSFQSFPSFQSPMKEVQIPSLSLDNLPIRRENSFPFFRKQEMKDLSNPVEIRFEDKSNESQAFPNLPPLQIKRTESQSRSAFPESRRLPQQAPLFNLNKPTYNPLQLNGGENHESLFDILHGRREVSQTSPLSNSNILGRREGFDNSPLKFLLENQKQNELLLAMRRQNSNVEQSCYTGMMNPARGLPTRQPDQQNDPKMNFLLNQLHSLENLFCGVKNQLTQLELSLKEKQPQPRMEEIRQIKLFEKRSLSDVLQENQEEYQLDSLYKKVKVE